jgi:TonB family protein
MQQSWIDWQGRTIDGKFELRRYLGESEHNAVFLTAIGSLQSREAAIKIVPADSENAERQFSSWVSAQKLSHPHLMSVLETGKCSVAGTNYNYIVMDFAEENLAAILTTRSLTLAEVQEMLGPMVGALSYLHSQGFVHGHLKPSNVMAVGDQLKISSDGILKTGDASPEASAYLPPEAKNGSASPSWDVWSLGIALTEVLTQRRPAIRADADVEGPVRTLPPPLQSIVRRCLRIDPQQRAILANIQNEQKSTPPALTQIAKPQTANATEPLAARNLLLVPVVIVVLLAAVAGVFLLKRGDSKAPPPQVVPQPATTSESIPSVQPPPNPNATEPGKIVRQVMPDVPVGALHTIHGTVKVKVRVHVDATGTVQRSALISGAGNRYFANKSIDASNRWTFAAPMTDGKAVPSQWELEFQFNRAAMHAHAFAR